MLFKYGYDVALLAAPMRYGPTFKRPSKRMMRKVRNANGSRMFEAEQLRTILDAAGQPLKAMILLGINCGFGNADVGTLPLKALDLNVGWVNYPRPKTGVERRCPLWKETVKALQEAIDRRPTPKDDADAGMVFITRCGTPWYKPGVLTETGTAEGIDGPLSKEMAKLLTTLGMKRRGLSFYALRHTFETIGGEARDQVAVDHVMGHARDDMASLYRERISDERLKAVVEHVHDWLFPPKPKGKKPKAR